ncbi:MAG: NFACT family protein [Acidobacteriota bacterium]|nr:NFACT family protein [Acidobacteriota bacterium]
MHQQTIKEIVAELSQLLPDRFLGKVFQLSEDALAIDFGLKSDGYLFISVDPAAPRLYLIKRTVRELEKSSAPLSAFAQGVRATLGGGRLLSIKKAEDERIVRFSFEVTDELGDVLNRTLLAQLTGRSANLFLLDHTGVITHAFRSPRGEGQQVGEQYSQPPQDRSGSKETEITRGNAATISAALDEHYRKLEEQQAFQSLAKKLLGDLQKEISKRKKLRKNLNEDLIAHGNPSEHKRLGDLLLANIATAEREDDKVRLTDYYAEGSPTIEIQIDANTSLQDAAGESFSRYAKSKRAVEEIGIRLVRIDRELEQLVDRQAKLEEAIATGNESALAKFGSHEPQARATGKKKKEAAILPGMRHYRSSDGYEVLVGRTARDNDKLTFRVARPNDLWLHAGDYPGSHVIVRNSSRKEIPHRTIIEAAQLAAKFSQASKDSKVAVHYTQRKFLTKPKGAASGLVRLSTFRTITVEPKEGIERV